MRSTPSRLGALVAATACVAGSLVLATASPAAAAPADVVISEVDVAADTVELQNTRTTDQDLGGMVLRDDSDDHALVIPAGTVLPAGSSLVLEPDAAALGDAGFGLGTVDQARLFAADGTALDSFAWTQDPGGSWSLCDGGFVATPTTTPGEANDCTVPPVVVPPAPVVTTLVVNEVESNGDDTDWVELVTTGDTPVDISGYTFRDDDDSRTPYTLPAGSVVVPGEFFVVDQAQGPRAGFDFGLGGADSARLFDPAGGLAASYSWTVHASTSYGRCPDGTGDLVTTTVSTKGEANDCSSPVRIDEVESSGGTPGDWVELTSVGVADVDVAGYALVDGDGGRTTLTAGTVVAPGGHLAVDLTGLGADDSVTLLAPDGTVVDSYAWTQHSATTYGRCPDVTGEFAVTSAPSKGAVNECAGILNPQPWSGGPEETPLDDEDTFGGDLSGLDWEPSGSSAPGTLWAVQNGDGLLYRITSDGAGGWAPEAEWTLGYPGGAAGIVDAEGVTVAGDDSAGGVYVSSERDNDANTVSRPSVLRYLPTGTGGALTATQEWNLAADFPGLGANAGLEGITWVPDSTLTAGGFVDQRTGSAYAPGSYPGHGDGLFVVGVEGTASVYAYALSTDGSYARVATLATPFALVADVQFDADLGALWVVCDEACGGQTALYELGDDGALAATTVYSPPADADPGLANEGFAIADAATCSDGYRATFYADDADTDGFSLRTGTFPCAPQEPGAEPTPGPMPGTGTGTAPGGQPAPPVSGSPVAPAAGAGPTRSALAATGSELGGWAASGAVLLLVGGTALVAGRRRTAG
jgi:hypothetical protein